MASTCSVVPLGAKRVASEVQRPVTGSKVIPAVLEVKVTVKGMVTNTFTQPVASGAVEPTAMVPVMTVQEKVVPTRLAEWTVRGVVVMVTLSVCEQESKTLATLVQTISVGAGQPSPHGPGTGRCSWVI